MCIRDRSYLDHMRCLEDVGMLSTTPIHYNGQEIVPIQFLKALLPDPASLGPRTDVYKRQPPGRSLRRIFSKSS